MKTYDLILVLGAGIESDGTNFKSVKENVKKAVELHNQGVAPKVVFSGKWSYKINSTPPPITEAEAMSSYAKSLGLSEEVIELEMKSDTTVTNIYYLKKEFFEPNNWKNILLVTLPIIYERAFFTLTKMLGPKYNCDYLLSDYKFPEKEAEERKVSEQEKLQILKEGVGDIKDGDEEAVFQMERKYLKDKNLI